VQLHLNALIKLITLSARTPQLSQAKPSDLHLARHPLACGNGHTVLVGADSLLTWGGNSRPGMYATIGVSAEARRGITVVGFWFLVSGSAWLEFVFLVCANYI
jgi:hypothetical protein